MTLQEAIEIVTKFDNGEYSCDAPTFRKAVQLLIGAGKRVDTNRQHPRLIHFSLLPGETKD